MSVVRELVTKLRFVYDNSGLRELQNGLKNTKSRLNQFSQNVRTSGRGAFGGMSAALDGVRAKIRGLGAEWTKQRAVMARAKNIQAIRQAKNNAPQADGGGVADGLLSVKNMAMGYLGAIAGGSVMQIADSWASVSGRIKLATKDAEEHKYVMDEVYNISQRTGQAMEATGDLFQKVARNQKDLGLQTKDTLKLTEIIGQTLTIGGGDESANSAGLLQLGQALAAGKLSGDELNSVIEQTPRLAEAIAKSFGIGVGQLKEMGKNGKLTAKELAQGLLKQADAIQKEFDSMPKTFSSSMTKMKNAFGKFINYAVNDVLHLGDVFAYVADWIEKNIKLVLILATSAIGAKLMLAIRTAQGGIRALGASIWKAMAPMLPWIALFATLGLIIEDLYVWANGGNSLAGELFGDFSGWAEQFDEIKQSAELVWSTIKDLFKEIAALTGIDLKLDFNSWKDGFKASFEYVLDGIRGLLDIFYFFVSTIKYLIKGDFSFAFEQASSAISNLQLKFLPFYGIALMVFGGIGAAVWWLIKSPFKLLFKSLKLFKGLFKVGSFLLTPLKPFWTITKVSFKTIRLLTKGWKKFGDIFGWLDVKVGQKFFALGAKAGKAFGFIKQKAVSLGGFLKRTIPNALRFIWRGFSKFGSVAWSALRWVGSGVGWLGRAFFAFSKVAISAIWSIARAMFAAMASNPILLAISLIIGAIVLIIVYWDEIKAIAGQVWDWISAKAVEIWDSIKAKMNEVWEEMKTSAQAKWESVTSFFSTLWTDTTNTFSNLWNTVVNKVTRSLNSMIPQGVKDFFNKIANFFGKSGNKNINVNMNVNGNLNALQQLTGMRHTSNVQNNHIQVNAANRPAAVAQAVAGAVGSVSRNNYAGIGKAEA